MHVCVQDECEKNDKLSGLHFICYVCKKKAFTYCAIENDEVKRILVALKIIVVDRNGTVHAKITDETKTDFDLLFGATSHISYTCNNCRELNMLEALKRTLNDKKLAIKNLTEANNSMQKATEIEILSKNDEIKQLNDNIQEMQQQIDEKNKLIGELTEASDHPNKITDYGIQSTDIGDKNVPSNFEEMSNKLLNSMSAMLKCELEKISSKVANECENMKTYYTSLLNENGNNIKGPKRYNPFSNRTVTFETPQSNESIDNDESNQNDHRTKFSVNLIPGEPNTPAQNETSEQQQQNQQHTSFSDRLNVPVNSNNRIEEVYAIHVSRFPLNIVVDDIIQHIMNNTEIINPDAFKIERLDKLGSDFISFKISTLKHDVYKMILDIWAPHYTARNFNTSPHKYKRTPKPTPKKFHPERYANETPRNESQRHKNVTPHRREHQQYAGNVNNSRSNASKRFVGSANMTSFGKRGMKNRNNNFDRMQNDRERVNHDQLRQNQQTQPEQQQQQRGNKQQQQQPQQIVVLPYQTNAAPPLQTAFLGNHIIQQPIQQQPQQIQPGILPIQYVQQQQQQQQWLQPQVQTFLQ